MQQYVSRRIQVPILLPTLLLCLGLTALNSSPAADRQDPSVYEYKDARELVAMVNQAAELFAQKGKEAYREFSQRGSRWLQGERYIFIYDLNGICLFNPSQPQLVGKNLIGLKDAVGRPVVRWIMDIAADRNKPYGWVHYYWPPPESLFPLWKSAYIVGVRGPDGKLYALGSGLYNMRPEKRFIVDLVKRAAKLIKQEGGQAFSTLCDKSSRYNLLGTYVYVFSISGEMRVDPAFPPGKERNALEFKDATGHYFIREAIDRLKNQETAWIMYMWPRPGEVTPSKKLMFVQRVQADDKTYVVGSDLYLSHPIWLHL